MIRPAALALTVLMAACGSQTPASAPAPAPQPAPVPEVWTLLPGQSHLAFTTIKAGSVAENSTFTDISGRVDRSGRAQFVVALDSVSTAIDIRDARMREHLFETGSFPQAVFTADIDMAALGDLAVGERRAITLAGLLDLHGVQVPVEAQVYVTRIAPDRVSVETIAPVLIQAGDFNLEPGIEVLRGLANLPSITPTVPVSVSLVFAG